MQNKRLSISELKLCRFDYKRIKRHQKKWKRRGIKVNFKKPNNWWRWRGSPEQVIGGRIGAVPSSEKEEESKGKKKKMRRRLELLLFIMPLNGLDLRSPHWMPNM